MADASYTVNSFLGGLWSKSMQGRVDRPDYKTALNECLNSLPNDQGAHQKRSGTGVVFGATTRGGASGRIISFDFNQAAPYNVEFTNGHLRFFNGFTLATTNDSVGILAVSGATPAVVQTTSAVTWSTGDQGFFLGLGTTSPLLQNRVFALTKIDTTHFSLADAVTGAPINGATLGFAVTGGATFNRALDLASPYAGGTWAAVRTVPADIPITQGTTPGMVLLDPAIKPQILQVVTPPSGPTFATFTLGPISFLDGPYFDPVTTNETITISAASGSATIIASGAAFGGFKATDVGRLIRFFIEPPAFNGALGYVGGNVVSFPPTTPTTGAQYWHCVSAGTTSVQPGTDLTQWIPQTLTKDVAVWSWAIITAFTSATQVTAAIQLGIPIYSNVGGPGVPPTLPITLWRMGLYSDTTGWPTCGTYHEGRLWLSGALGNRIDGSKSNDPFNFAPTSIIGQVADNNAIAYRFNAPDVNPIFWMSPEGQGIVCGTQAGEWLVQATTLSAPLTPTTIQAHRHTKNGCANIEPRRTDHTLIVVQKFLRKALEYFPDVFSGKYSAQDIFSKGKVLTKPFIAEIAYQQELTSIVWARMEDGSLAGVTYKRETLVSSQEATAGAHRHALGSGRVVESITAGGTADGTLDALAMVTNDPVTNIRHVEIMQTMWEEGDPLASAWFLDDAARPSSTVVNPPAVGAPYGGMTLNGLWYLNGKTVQVFAGGLDCGDPGEGNAIVDFVVANASVFVPFGDGISAGSGAGLFTQAFATAAAAAGTILIGFTYNSDGQVLPPYAREDTGARSGPGAFKTIRSAYYGLKVFDTAGLSIGTDFTHLNPVLFKDAQDNPLGSGQVFNGDYRDMLGDNYSFSSKLCWRSTRPLPANLSMVGAFPHTQDL